MAKHGGKRPNAGRKSKAEEVAVIENMDTTLAPDKVWQALADRVLLKDVQAIKLWLSYRFGQPKQQLDVTSDGKPFPTPTIVIPKSE